MKKKGPTQEHMDEVSMRMELHEQIARLTKERDEATAEASVLREKCSEAYDQVVALGPDGTTNGRCPSCEGTMEHAGWCPVGVVECVLNAALASSGPGRALLEERDVLASQVGLLLEKASTVLATLVVMAPPTAGSPLDEAAKALNELVVSIGQA
jgi:hypothetical protein